MKDKPSRRVRKRTLFLGSGLLLWFAVLILRLVQLQVIEHTKYKKRVLNQKQNESVITPERGTIYDRSGTILARSIPAISIALRPQAEETQEILFAKVKKLRSVLALDAADIRRIQGQIKKDASFIWVERKVDSKTVEYIKSLSMAGIAYEEEPQRFYPQKTLVSHVLGRVDVDGIGQSGIERSYNSVLGGKQGRRLNFRDARQRNFEFEILENPVSGKDIYLAIDETIQYYALRSLEKARRNTKAKWGTVIVSHPATGDQSNFL